LLRFGHDREIMKREIASRIPTMLKQYRLNIPLGSLKMGKPRHGKKEGKTGMTTLYLPTSFRLLPMSIAYPLLDAER